MPYPALPIGRDRIVLRGRSLGAPGPGTWAQALRPLQVAAAPYAATRYATISQDPRTELRVVSAAAPASEKPAHARLGRLRRNAGMVPAVALLGEKDVFSAHAIIGRAMAKEGRRWST